MSCPAYLAQLRPAFLSREASRDQHPEQCPMVMLSAHHADEGPGVLGCVKGSHASRAGFAARDPACALQAGYVVGDGQTDASGGGSGHRMIPTTATGSECWGVGDLIGTTQLSQGWYQETGHHGEGRCNRCSCVEYRQTAESAEAVE